MNDSLKEKERIAIQRLKAFEPEDEPYYTVSFEEGTYNGNKENVGAEYFNLHKDGENVNAVFERQWRADGSETYEIYLER